MVECVDFKIFDVSLNFMYGGSFWIKVVCKENLMKFNYEVIEKIFDVEKFLVIMVFFE